MLAMVSTVRRGRAVVKLYHYQFDADPAVTIGSTRNPGGSMKSINCIAVSIVCTLLIAAKPAKAPSLPPSDIFFTMKGQPFALERSFPGITAAFIFTEDQKTALNEAYQQTVASPEIRTKGSSLKNNSAATDADREAVHTQIEDARAELQKRVATILTPEQKALIPKIQNAAEEAQKNAREASSADFAAAKGDQAKAKDLREKIRVEAEDQFARQLEKFLTAAQMEAVRAAAEQQHQAEEQARKNKLGK